MCDRSDAYKFREIWFEKESHDVCVARDDDVEEEEEEGNDGIGRRGTIPGQK